ncbi:hypothetical protein SUDANB105_07643 [Streptomyces sp. enrichment culture]|uniref:hypothetical protein n=1 Tax=Streptomyces sp. enrichment culture TaxID=1795815 RepID=UPI003F5699D2
MAAAGPAAGAVVAVRRAKARPSNTAAGDRWLTVTNCASARLADADPRQDLRRALREAKALLEAGEVLQPDTPPTTHDTPGGKLMGLLSRRAGGEGVL